MIIYCLLLYIVALIVFLKKKNYKVDERIICFLLLFISGFRYMIGIDYENYMNGYSNPDAISYEPIWYIVTSFLNFLGLSFQSFFLLTSSIIALCTYKALKRYGDSVIIIGLFIFIMTNLYIESMNLVRQYVAMSITFLAFSYRRENKNVKYVLLMALATACHTTALICIPIFEISRYKCHKLLLLLLILFSLTSGKVFSTYFLDILIAHTDSTFQYSSYLANKSYIYISSGTYKYLLNFAALFFILRQDKILDDKYYSILNLFIISVCMYNVFLYFDVGIRLSKYFFYFIIILIPLTIQQSNKFLDKVIIVLLSIGFMLFTLKDVMSPAYNPYLFNFDLIS